MVSRNQEDDSGMVVQAFSPISSEEDATSLENQMSSKPRPYFRNNRQYLKVYLSLTPSPSPLYMDVHSKHKHTKTDEIFGRFQISFKHIDTSILG